jgi:uncharacterized membrane protein (UPF0182 family)
LGFGGFAGTVILFWNRRQMHGQFSTPRVWPARIALALLGLVCAVVLYLGLGLIPRDLRQISIAAFVGYLVLVVIAVRVWPVVMERFSGDQA